MPILSGCKDATEPVYWEMLRRLEPPQTWELFPPQGIEHPVWLMVEPGERPNPQKHSVETSTPVSRWDLERQNA